MAENEKMLSVENLVVSYGAIKALKGISFDVKKGEIISLIGSNSSFNLESDKKGGRKILLQRRGHHEPFPGSDCPARAYSSSRGTAHFREPYRKGKS